MGRKFVPRVGNPVVQWALHRKFYGLAMTLLFAGFVCSVAVTYSLNQISHPWGLWFGAFNLILFGWVRMKQVDKHAYAIMRKMSYDTRCRVYID